jgi:hypothetical protein
LPEANYLMMLDKVFLLAYVFILVAIARAVATSWRGTEAKAQKAIGRATASGLPPCSLPISRPRSASSGRRSPERTKAPGAFKQERP